MAANFFEQQAHARSATNRLVVLYVMAVLSIMAVITFIFHIFFLVQRNRLARLYQADTSMTASNADVIVALVVLAIIVIGTLVRIAQLGGSGERVAEMLGGAPVDPSTKDPLERRLMNVVEEMAIASGIAVPRVYILRNEEGINAFAAGLQPGQAVIGITRGTLEQLTRDELQGVVAHEFSHIFNGDMRLNIRLMGVLGGILALATIGRLLFQVSPNRVRSSDSKNEGGSLVLFGIALFVVGYIGVFFARLIKAAVSRQREYLADASAVQYTRNPDGIGGALMKIRGFAPSSKINSHFAEEASHMFFGSALDFSSVFATHPPLVDRIGRVAPILLKPGAWSPRDARDETSSGSSGEVETIANDSLSALSANRADASPARPLPLPTPTSTSPIGFSSSRVSTPNSSSTGSVAPAAKSVLASIGAPQAADIEAARAFLDGLPPAIRERTRDRQGAVLLVISLFLESSKCSPEQTAILAANLAAEEVQEILDIRAQLESVGETDRLSILALSLPPLRQLTEQSKQMLMKVSHDLAHSDGEFELYEYVALTLIEHQLMRDLKASKPRPTITSQRTSNDLSILLSAVAYAGADDLAAAKKSFDIGVTNLTSSLNQALTFRDLDECKLDLIADSIERLSYLEPTSQKKLIEACTKTVLADGLVTTKESELLRALCAVLEAPLPAIGAF